MLADGRVQKFLWTDTSLRFDSTSIRCANWTSELLLALSTAPMLLLGATGHNIAVAIDRRSLQALYPKDDIQMEMQRLATVPMFESTMLFRRSASAMRVLRMYVMPSTKLTSYSYLSTQAGALRIRARLHGAVQRTNDMHLWPGRYRSVIQHLSSLRSGNTECTTRAS